MQRKASEKEIVVNTLVDFHCYLKVILILNVSNKEVKDTPPQCFIAYHVYVMEEKEAVKESKSNDYEMQLYQDYVEREGVQKGL